MSPTPSVLRSPAALSLAAAIVAPLILAPRAAAQFAVPRSTVDGGGTSSTGGAFAITGTIGQPDAGPGTTGMAGGTLVFNGGFWSGIAHCPGDFNGDGHASVQDIFDFLAAWFAASPRADFNYSGAVSVQDIFDFLAAWFAGCP